MATRGDKLSCARVYGTTAERFWPKVAMTGNVCECWEWTAGKQYKGYGQFVSIASRANGIKRGCKRRHAEAERGRIAPNGGAP